MTFNPYGDKPTFLAAGHGADIASQRADDLDDLAIKHLTPQCRALDFASGAGGQAGRMSAGGAVVTAVDMADLSAAMPPGIDFIRGDMRHPQQLLGDVKFRVIVWQRAVHYLPFHEAIVALSELSDHLGPNGKIFMSASGIGSELGVDYAGVDIPLASRYFPLSEAMSSKHGIHGDVCLYGPDDIRTLAETAGLVVEQLFVSTFGNIKCVMSKMPGA
jgi:SAM-dependent methyltransferase